MKPDSPSTIYATSSGSRRLIGRAPSGLGCGTGAVDSPHGLQGVEPGRLVIRLVHFASPATPSYLRCRIALIRSKSWRCKRDGPLTQRLEFGTLIGACWHRRVPVECCANIDFQMQDCGSSSGCGTARMNPANRQWDLKSRRGGGLVSTLLCPCIAFISSASLSVGGSASACREAQRLEGRAQVRRAQS